MTQPLSQSTTTTKANELRAILVSVNYSDLLKVTLPYNRHHFSEVMVVTDENDYETPHVALDNDAAVYATSAFYDDGADFNKWKALEEALDNYGRHGWIVVMDADILWPKELPEYTFRKDYLYTPLCHIMRKIRGPMPPPERDWPKFPLRPNQREWAGYSQIFHAEDKHLPPAPWHQIDWKHAGGADSFFQKRWSPEWKIRPPWKVFHIGEHGRNWCGRATPKLDGSANPEADTNRRKMNQLYTERRKNRSMKQERIR